MSSPSVVGVSPPAARASRVRLFDALEHAFSVRFEARQPGDWHGLDGAIVFGADGPGTSMPDRECKVLLIAPGDCVVKLPAPVRFSNDMALDRRLRGQSLVERGSTPASRLDNLRDGDALLAACSERAVWVHRRRAHGTCWVVSTPPSELDPTETLHDHLTAGRFLGLLPLTHFLRDLEVGEGWQAPPLRAAFIFDDPNLHAESYGFLHYPRLAEHARRHGYHVAMASIPLDYRFAHPAAIRLFREYADALSLVIHGNNHDRLELLRADSPDVATALAAQALRRTAAFERRSGLSVARVMVPPHEVCSDAMHAALFRLGVEAVSTAHLLRPDAAHASPGRLLAEWTPAQFVAGGLPILARHSLGRSLDDAVLRAYLDQPLLLFGHHQDAAGGLDRLEEAAARINGLGSVQWGSLTDICGTNVAVRRHGSVLSVRLYTRRVVLSVPEGVDELVVELPAAASTGGPMEILRGVAGLPASLSEVSSTSVRFEGPFAPTVELRVRATAGIEAEDVPPPTWRLWPIVRRGLTESRDRIAPLRQHYAPAKR